MASTVLGTVGGIIGNSEASGQQAAAGQDIQQALDNYQNIQVPTIGEQQWNLTPEQLAGTLSPEQMSAAQMGPNALAGIQTNPAYTAAQNQQLAALQQLGAGGMTAQEQQNLIQSQQAAAGQAQSQNAAILQQMGARGMGGSGAQLAAQLSNSQNAANQASNNANAYNAMAQQNALGAMSGAGGLASQLQQAQFGQQAAVAQAQNAINQFNTMNQQNTNAYNTSAANQAQAANLSNAQNVSNTNTNLSNQSQEHNTGLYQQQFGNQMAQAGAEAGVLGQQSNYNQNQANATRGMWSGIGSAAGDALDEGGAYLSSSGGGSGSSGSSSSEPDWANAPDASDMWNKGGRIPNKYADGGQVMPQLSPQQIAQLQQAQSMAATGGVPNPLAKPQMLNMAPPQSPLSGQAPASSSLSPAQLASIQAMLSQKSPTPQGTMVLGLPGGQPAPQASPQAMAKGGKVQGSDLSPAALEKLGHFMAQFGKDKKNEDKQIQKFAEGGKVLDANARAHIAPHNFALPGGRYPIEDANHARNALARVAQHGTPEEQAKVRAAVHSKYPSIGHAQGGMINPPDYNKGGEVSTLGMNNYDNGGMVNGIMKLAPLAMMALSNGGKVPDMTENMAQGGMAGSLMQLAPLALMALNKGGKVPGEHNKGNLEELKKSFGKFISEEEKEPKKMYEGGNLTGLPHAPPAKKPDSTDMEQSFDSGGQVQNSGGLSPEAKQQILASLANTFAPTPKATPKQYAAGQFPNAEDAAAYGEAATMTPAQKAELAQTQAAMAKFRAANNMPADDSLPNPNNTGMAKGGMTHSALDVGMAMVSGGHVPGKAKVKGDSPKNDIVDAKLSPGEIVIPRSKVNKSDDEILDFVKKAREGKRK